MPRKIYTIANLGCANCAAKMEAKINALPQVEEATITFTTRQLRITAADPDALLPQVQQIISSIEPDAAIATQEHHHHEHHGHCHCGHDHEHHDHCGCGHDHGHHDHCGRGHDHEHHDHCGCGHDHEHHDHCGCGHDHGHHEHSGKAHDRELLTIVGGAALFAAGLVLEWLALTWVAFAVFVLAYVALGWEVLKTAGKNLLRGHVFDENFLMSIATLGAFVIREFPEAVGVMLFYRVGEYFERKAVERSRSQIMEAVDLRPEVVNLVHGDAVETVPAGQAKPGDVLLVRPGDRIPLDGTVLTGESRIDTAPITGEPVPVHVKAGSPVVSGCVNTSGQLTVRVDKPLSESMVTRILDSVENAAASKPKIDRFITRFARIYTPIVVIAAVLTATVPPLALDGNWNYWVYTALSFLVMSCPCALVLSVPLAFFSGIGVGSKQGILFKGGASIEALAGIKAVALDKTGTVTKGDFSVQEVSGGEELLRLCASCEQHSTHPIAQSITAAAREKGLTLSQSANMEELPGKGIRACVDGKQVLCGNAALLEAFGITPCPVPNGEGTLVLVAVDGAAAGWIRIADTLKPDAAQAVKQLHDMGIATAMLTGDAEATARQIAAHTGIQAIHPRLLPGEKLEVLQTLRNDKGATMFVGDGINDAPVLSGADVGAAMGSGADAAIEAADVVFMTNAVCAIPQSIQIARRTKAVAWQNVIFALGIKAIVMVLGLCGGASMWMAVFADSGVAMLCVLNSIRQLYRKSIG